MTSRSAARTITAPNGKKGFERAAAIASRIACSWRGSGIAERSNGGLTSEPAAALGTFELSLLRASAEEPCRAGDLRLEYGDIPFSRPAFFCFSSGHFSGLLCVFSDYCRVKYIAA